MSGAIAAQADGRVAVKETLTGVAVGPLLRDFAQKDTLEGKGTVALDVNAAGKTVNTMKKSLAGTARVALKDGAIKGINLAEVFRRAKTALGSSDAKAQARDAQQTDFSEMTASFTLKNGVAHNEDLDIKAPLFRVSGKGDIDIGNSTIDYVTKATVVQRPKARAAPISRSSPALRCRCASSGPSTRSSIRSTTRRRDGVREVKAGERLKGALEERLGIAKPPAGGEQAAPGGPPSGQGSSGNALDKLKGLLGR